MNDTHIAIVCMLVVAFILGSFIVVLHFKYTLRVWCCTNQPRSVEDGFASVATAINTTAGHSFSIGDSDSEDNNSQEDGYISSS